MFVNFTNHPSDKWSEAQLNAAKEMGGEIVDIAFPAIDSHASSKEVEELAREYANQIFEQHPDVVLCQGEPCFTQAAINSLQINNIKCVAACSDRKVVEEQLPDGTTKKTSTFEFVQFREIPGRERLQLRDKLSEALMSVKKEMEEEQNQRLQEVLKHSDKVTSERPVKDSAKEAEISEGIIKVVDKVKDGIAEKQKFNEYAAQLFRGEREK